MKLVKKKLAKENKVAMRTGDDIFPNEGVASSTGNVDVSHPHIMLPCKGSNGLALIKSCKKCLSENWVIFYC